MTDAVDLTWAAAAARPGTGQLHRYLELLRELVDLDTPSRDIEAVKAAFDVLGTELEERGLSARSVTGEDDVPVLVADSSGEADLPRVGFVGHIDTVFGPDETENRPFRLEGDRATGPGVADMKGGLVSILYTVDLLRRHETLPPLRITVNGDEEVGSASSRHILRREMNDRDVVLVFEPGRPNGAFVTHRRGTVRARLTVDGVAAHSGVAPRSGANAIHDLAQRITAIAQLGDRYPECDINVTLVRGGQRINIVPEQASCDFDARTSTVDDDESLRHDLQAIASGPGVPGTSASLEWQASRPPLEPSDAQGPLLDSFVTAATSTGVDFEAVGTGGGSDANLLGGLGAAILDGCGPVGDNYHRTDEYVQVHTIAERAALVAAGLTVYTQRHRHA